MALEKLDVSGFDTSKVTNMNSMFSDCQRLTSINVSSFNTTQDIKGKVSYDAINKTITAFLTVGADTQTNTASFEGTELAFKLNRYEFSVNMDIRVIWQYEGDNIIALVDIGHHDILYK